MSTLGSLSGNDSQRIETLRVFEVMRIKTLTDFTQMKVLNQSGATIGLIGSVLVSLKGSQSRCKSTSLNIDFRRGVVYAVFTGTRLNVFAQGFGIPICVLPRAAAIAHTLSRS